jgi:hypothetical protein
MTGISTEPGGEVGQHNNREPEKATSSMAPFLAFDLEPRLAELSLTRFQIRLTLCISSSVNADSVSVVSARDANKGGTVTAMES